MDTKVLTQDYGSIEERVLKCIINIDGLGTGFLVERQIPNQLGKSKIFLITNKHMIGSWNMVDPFIPKPKITGYFYSNQLGIPTIALDITILDAKNNYLPTVKIHPRHKIDIVVIDVTQQILTTPNLYISRLDMSYLVPLEDIGKNTYTGVGDQVFAIGYPAGITSKNTNLPIVKSGFISSSLSGDLEIYSNWKDRIGNIHKVSGEGKFFLVDGLIVGGNSGGPIVHPRQRKYKVEKGQLSYTKDEIPNLVFGIVSYTLTDTGISVIYSSDHILELINQF